VAKVWILYNPDNDVSFCRPACNRCNLCKTVFWHCHNIQKRAL